MAVEIERKFMVTDPPAPDVLGTGSLLRQGYLAEEGDVEVRVRIADAGSTLTVKAGSGLRRTEVETAISRVEAEELWHHTAGRRIDKRRHRVMLGADVAEVDVFAGALAGLVTVEVEFASEVAASAFTQPAWFGAELTGEPGWSNAALARHGPPHP